MSYDEVRELRRMREDGLLPPDAPAVWALTPHYSVTCTILEMNPGEQASGGGFGIGPVRWGGSESIATVRVAVKVTSVREGDAGRAIWDGEARGEQIVIDRGGVASLSDAAELCVMDAVTKLAAAIPSLSGARIPRPRR